MLDGLWELTAYKIRVGWNVDERSGLAPAPLEVFRFVRSHRRHRVRRVFRYRSVARLVSLRIAPYVGGAR